MVNIEHQHENQRTIHNVPCLALSPAGEPIGQVVLVHGWGSSSDSYRFFASLIAGWGYRVIVPELPLHGERGTLDYWNPSVLQENFWNVVVQGVREAGGIAAELTRESVLPVTIVGHSAGGFISAGAYADQDDIRSAIVINGSCSWVRFEELYREKSGLPAITPDEHAALAAHDPRERILALSKPLLLLHCADDAIVPVGSQHDFVEEAAKRRTSGDAVQFHAFERVNHVITLGMLQHIHAFLTGNC
ncbi:alpha/beta fold hydrolase [Paenibacillus rhizovicinus]|uniref:Alpha/beta fold hydrolase n=1 Tax=Paenibacillus rhizovicinus TaxID=2704463 RepID=A0A6C0P4Q4_9BACL|nr:alpha/beta fold hydrolase [Paenibacillus rhizovicinus]QHW33530.1 alpha/beta fold hydrolase [Paenibacillus rhizovicinus]